MSTAIIADFLYLAENLKTFCLKFAQRFMNMEQSQSNKANKEDLNADNSEQMPIEEENKGTEDVPNTDPIAELEKQVSEWNDKYIRLMAEFDNFRKRTKKEKEDLLKYAGEEIWKGILPVIDDFERAIKDNNQTQDITVIKQGFELIYNKINHTIQQKGIQPLICLHQPFDVDTMEAVARVPAPSEDMKGKVIDELEKGYKLQDRIIRFAKVVVGE